MDSKYKKNDCVTVTVEDLGTEGEGIGKVDGFTLFIKDTVPGDIVKAKIIKSKKNYAYARLEKVITPSPFRVEPKCASHRQCGGCQLQTLSYERQLEFKQQKISSNLIRIGGFSPEYIEERMEPIIGMEEPYRYRNKAQYPVGKDKDGNIITGFYAGRTHTIIANTECYLGAEENKMILDIIMNHMRMFHISTYDETTGKGLVRHILIRKGFTSGQIMVCLVLNKNIKLHPERDTERNLFTTGSKQDDSCLQFVKRSYGGKGENVSAHMEAQWGQHPTYGRDTGDNFCRKPEQPAACGMQQINCGAEYYSNIEFISGQDILLEDLASVKGMTSVSVSINTERTNVIMGKEIYTIWGSPTISDTIHVRDMQKEGYPFTGKELTFHISPLSFYQINPEQTEKLYSLALEYAQLTGEETVWDLYCGIGTISLFLAADAKKVYGVEVIPQAIEDARENAERNGIGNVDFFLGKAEEVLPEFYERKDRFCKGNFRGISDESDMEKRNCETGSDGLGFGQDAGYDSKLDAGQDAGYDSKLDVRHDSKLNYGTDVRTNMLHPGVIVVDPPRKGCDEACLNTMLKMKPQRIVYVSCDSSTLARDLKVLCDGGYEICKIRGVTGLV